jgi:hypothetical protein
MLRSVRGKGIGKDMHRCPLNKKNEKNRKRREARQRNKGHNVMPNVSGGDEKRPILINKSAHKPTIGK